MESERWRQIERLYHAALEREGSGRTAFLQEACGGDQELRREVESLLASGAAAGTFIEAPAIEVAAKALVRDPALLAMDRDGVKSGSTVSHYQILEKLGAGGMGEVYRARDTKLGREVALKVLPEALAHDRERMARFQREAKILASLNHPNIATIYGLEESGHVRALVMELVEGPTLEERIARADVAAGLSPARAGLKAASTAGTHGRPQGAPLPFDEALGIAKQIAEALEYAHEHGVIHRDLKPANLKIKPDGAVKVLDFGIAKALEAGTASNDVSSSLTPETAATRAGMILGTAAYMSPEQARGQAVDRRTDIWAFGCVLYEMLAGRKAFTGETTGDTLAAVITKEPEWGAIPAATPPAIQKLVRRCLTKDPKRRLQAIGEARITIEETLSGTAGVAVGFASPDETAQQAEPLQPSWRRSLPWAVALTLAALAAAAAWVIGRRASVRPPPTFHQLTFDRGLIYSARFAPGDRSIYYSAGWNGQPVQLYETQPSSPESRPLALKDSALLAVSSSELAITIGCKDLFIGDCEGTLATVPVSGGAPREIATGVLSADWTADGSTMAVIRHAGGKFRVEFPPGRVIYESGDRLNFLRISPRGDAVAFVALSSNAGDEGRAVILDRDGRPIARSSREFTSIEGLAWARAGNEVWFAGNSNQGWADAIHSLSLTGKERTILRLPGMVRLHDVSRDGRVLFSKDVWRTGMQFRTTKDAEERDLSWLDSPILTDLAPDGQRLAFDEWGLTTGAYPVAYVRKTDGSPPVELGPGFDPTLSPDQKWALVALFDPARLALVPTGAGEARILGTRGFMQFESLGWMPGGREISFSGNDGHDWRLYVQDLTGSAPRAITPPISVKAQYYEGNLAAPNGQVLFARDETGTGRLYPLSGGNPQAVAGLSPEDIWVNWAADGQSAYVYQDKASYGLMFRVDLTTGSRRLVAKLAPSDPAGLTSIAPARITPDGRFCAYSDNRALSDLFLGEGLK